MLLNEAAELGAQPGALVCGAFAHAFARAHACAPSSSEGRAVMHKGNQEVPLVVDRFEAKMEVLRRWRKRQRCRLDWTSDLSVSLCCRRGGGGGWHGAAREGGSKRAWACACNGAWVETSRGSVAVRRVVWEEEGLVKSLVNTL